MSSGEAGSSPTSSIRIQSGPDATSVGVATGSSAAASPNRNASRAIPSGVPVLATSPFPRRTRDEPSRVRSCGDGPRRISTSAGNPVIGTGYAERLPPEDAGDPLADPVLVQASSSVVVDDRSVLAEQVVPDADRREA